MIFMKKNFFIFKKKIDEAAEKDLNNQNESILKDYKKIFFYIKYC